MNFEHFTNENQEANHLTDLEEIKSLVTRREANHESKFAPEPVATFV
jgi:hypothetical protein